MKRILPLALAAALVSSAAIAQDVTPTDPVSGSAGVGALGTETLLAIAAGVIVVGVLVASNDDSTSGT